MKEFAKTLIVIVNTISIVWFLGAVIAALPWNIRLPLIVFIITFFGYHLMGD